VTRNDVESKKREEGRKPRNRKLQVACKVSKDKAKGIGSGEWGKVNGYRERGGANLNLDLGQELELGQAR
jgi:hypothetical protein